MSLFPSHDLLLAEQVLYGPSSDHWSCEFLNAMVLLSQEDGISQHFTLSP